jgi:four helix bundle protein
MQVEGKRVRRVRRVKAGEAGEAGEGGEAGEAAEAGEAGEAVANVSAPGVRRCCEIRDRWRLADSLRGGILTFRGGTPLALASHVSRFEDLVAWQLAVRLRRIAHRYCEKPAIRNNRRFHDNLSDAASSAPRNIAEGHGRKYHREFARFAIIARGSEKEVLESFAEAYERGYIDTAEFDAGDHAARQALRVLNRLIAYLEDTPDWGRN